MKTAILPLIFILFFPNPCFALVEGMTVRCFAVTDVKVSCDDCSESERKPAADLLIETYAGGSKYSYGYLRGIEGALCWRHLKAIRRLMKGVSTVCVTGWGESFEKNEYISHWDALETKRGTVRRNDW